MIVAFGTAFLEETLFRGIVLSSTYYCRRYSDGKIAFALIWSSIVCAAVQLKDFAGSDVVTLLVNMIYAFVMGMFFGALFLRCRNLFSVMVIHWIINFFSLIFVYGSKETPGWTIYIYALILLFILVASIYLLRSSKINSVYGLWGSYSNKSRYKRYK